MKKILLSIILLVFLILSKRSNGQIIVNDQQTAAALVNSLVGGSGVNVQNPTLNCNALANGKFSAVGTNMGIDSGIVLTTGRAKTNGSSYGVDGTPGSFASTNAGTGGDVDLTTLINANNPSSYPTSTNDACVLEFDFTPMGDTIKFDYFFGSEEYTTFNCSINDVFGFFITGQGYTTPTNIAIVPGTTNVMVGISTVNNGSGYYATSTNSCYFNTFGNGPYTQYYINTSATTPVLPTNYNGISKVFTAQAVVVPCTTYHLKLAIADASDHIYDSGVFLKAGSLQVAGIISSPTTGGGQVDTSQNLCVRGCTPAQVNYRRNSCDTATGMTLHFQIAGSAVNGVDYQFLPDSLVIPNNSSNASYIVNPLLFNTATGAKSVIFNMLDPDSFASGAANIPISKRDTVWIYDSLYAKIPVNSLTGCAGDSFTVTGQTAINLSAHWESPEGYFTNPQGDTTRATSIPPTYFDYVVTQPGAPATCQAVHKRINADLQAYPQLIFVKDTIVCLADSIDLPLLISPDSINYAYQWSNAPGIYLRDSTIGYNRFYAPVPNYYSYHITATSPYGCSTKDTMNIDVKPPLKISLISPVTGETTIDYGDQVTLEVGGALYYYWLPSGSVVTPGSPITETNIKDTTHFQVVAVDVYGCRDTGNITVNVKFPDNYVLPNAFSPNGDGVNDVLKIINGSLLSVKTFKIYDRRGQCVFETISNTKGWDGTYDNGKEAPMDSYFYILEFETPNHVKRTIKGDVTLIR